MPISYIGDYIQFASNPNKKYEVLELGFITPELIPGKLLSTGQVGYLAFGLKNPRDICYIGDTIFHSNSSVNLEPLLGFQKAKSKVFAGLYPEQPPEYSILKDSIEKLLLNDSSVSISDDNRFWIESLFNF